MSGYTSFSRVYDPLTADVDYPARAKALHRLIREHLPGGNLLLDLACGTGSFSLEFARLGWDVTAVDASAEMLTVARGKQGEEPILYLCQRMEELDLYGTVDAAVCLLDSFNHILDPGGLRRAFSRLRLFVAPGGLLLFDVNTEYKHTRVLGESSFVLEEPGLLCAWRNRPVSGHTVEMTLDFFTREEGGLWRRETETVRERLYTGGELTSMLAENGFRLLQILDGDTYAPPGDTAQRHLYLARREP